MQDKDKLVRMTELSRESGIPYQALKGLAKDGRAPLFRVGRGWYSRRGEFDAWLEAQRAAAPYFQGKAEA